MNKQTKRKIVTQTFGLKNKPKERQTHKDTGALTIIEKQKGEREREREREKETDRDTDKLRGKG